MDASWSLTTAEKKYFTNQENKKTKFHCISLSFISVQEYNHYCNYKQLKMGLLCLEVHVEKRKKKKQFSSIHSYSQKTILEQAPHYMHCIMCCSAQDFSKTCEYAVTSLDPSHPVSYSGSKYFRLVLDEIQSN